MRSFAQSVTSPIGGCFLMVLHLVDGLFTARTEATVHDVAQSKLRVFQAFASAFDVGSMGFLPFSPLMDGTGSIRQPNYVITNALLDGEIHKSPNAFSPGFQTSATWPGL